MNSGKTLGTTYVSNLKKIFESGYTTKPRGMEIKEILGGELIGKADEDQIISFQGIRDVSDFNTTVGQYLPAELLWYFSGSDMCEYIGMFGSIWNNIKSVDNTLNSNYGRAVFYNSASRESPMTKFDWVVRALKKDKDTRQAIIPYASGKIYSDQYGLDFTCTQLQHFFIRENKLHSLIYIRSSDSVFGLNFDIPFWSIVCQILRTYLSHSALCKRDTDAADYDSVIYNNLEMGDLKILIGSSHIYERHYKLCQKICSVDEETVAKSFKSLRIKDNALKQVFVFSENHDEEIQNMIYNEMSPALMDWLGEKDSSSLNILASTKHVNDPETDYLTRTDSIFYHSKLMMRVFRNAYYYALGKDSYRTNDTIDNPDIKEEKKNELKNVMLKYIKKWFDYYFEII